jgi:hypothetical protein
LFAQKTATQGRNISRPERNSITWANSIEIGRGKRKLHNEELDNLYSSPNIIRMIKSRRMRWAGHVARMGETRNAYRILAGKREGKRPLGRPRRGWVDSIKIVLK